MSQNYGHQRAYCPSPEWMWAWEPWRWWFRPRITPDSSTRPLWQSHQQKHLGRVGGMDEGVRILPISIWNTSRDLLQAVKSYDMGPSRFTSHPKEGVLRIFIALKNPSPRSGLSPRPLGPVASSLTTIPPRPQASDTFWYFPDIYTYAGRVTHLQALHFSCTLRNAYKVGRHEHLAFHQATL
jgi:hypothetical protein